MKPDVVILINALHSGGAERTCIELVRDLMPRCNFTVVALLYGGPAEKELRALGAEVVLLEGGGPMRIWAACWRLARLLRARDPVAVVTYLYASDFIGGIMARLFARRARVYWNVRNNVLGRHQAGLSSYVLARLNARLSRIPDAVLFCSSTARKQHRQLGFNARQDHVISNSIESVPFRFDANARARFRSRAQDPRFVFLFVGRFDPVKRVDVFLEAGAEVASRCDGGVRFFIAGRDMDTTNTWLMEKIAETGHEKQFDLLGFVTDREGLYSAADCLVVTSESEGSPNMVFEAVATGLPVIILATAGTENLSAPQIDRLATRDIAPLVEAMCGRSREIVPDATRVLLSAAVTAVRHPMAVFLERELSLA